ncbi:MAG: hypothetical protein ACKVH8_18620 [Pirellulales bacterium]|jgi:YHS domain-containing protein
MKHFTKIAMLVAVASFLALGAIAEEKAKKVKPTCPVSGKACSKEFAVDYKGGQTFFCCPNCPKAFEKDTAKFAAKANHQLVLTKQAKQAKCPLTGGKMKKETAVSVEGVSVAFCCNNCKGKVEKSEDAFALVFADKTFDKGYVIAKKKAK